jgi:hypothetical protein
MKLNLLLLSAAAMVNAAAAVLASGPCRAFDVCLEIEEIGAVNLGTAGTYAILAKTGISTVPASSINGDIAVSPIAASAITGFDLIMDPSTNQFSSSTQVNSLGKVYASDYKSPTPSTLTTAVSDMETAYTDAAGRSNNDARKVNLGFGDIGGLTLVPGVYTFDRDITISTTVTFDGKDGSGKANTTSVFILRTSGSVKQAANIQVILTNGAQAKNIFWQVAGTVTVGAGATLEGILLAKTAVAFITGSTLNGRILTQTACTLQSATVAVP